MPDDNQNSTDENAEAVITDSTSSDPTNSTDPTTNTTGELSTTDPPYDAPADVQFANNSETKPDDSVQVLTGDKHNNNRKKVIATIFGVLFLMGGVAAGVFLVQRQQNIAEKASSGAACNQSPDCILFDEPGNAGSNSVTKLIEYLDITNKPGEERRYYQGNTNDGCYNVSINGRDFSWQRVGDGPTCRDISNIQVWMGDEQSAISASCEATQAFDDDWNQLSVAQLSSLSPGDNIKFAVEGTTQGGTIDKARFRVNSSEWQETTDLKPGEASTYFINYTIPEDTKDFTVNAQVHLVENDNWY